MFLRNSRAALTPHNVHRTFFGAAVSLHVQRYGTNGGGEKTGLLGTTQNTAFGIFVFNALPALVVLGSKVQINIEIEH